VTATLTSTYFVGALLVTGPTVRGIPVCEFVSLTETKLVLQSILTFFEENNRTWTKIQAFIIDKDFTKISGIKALFVSAMVNM
jgi:hypothetical protein